jgi:hypothetical protein
VKAEQYPRWTVEIENETAEAEIEKFQQLSKQSISEIKGRNGN